MNYPAAELSPHSASLRIGGVSLGAPLNIYLKTKVFKLSFGETPQQADGVYYELINK
jgi:hypothetical protein